MADNVFQFPGKDAPSRKGAPVGAQTRAASGAKRGPAGSKGAAGGANAASAPEGGSVYGFDFGPGRLLEIKATMLFLDPPIWRRILVPADESFEILADALTAAFGWSGEYLYYFRKDGTFFDDPRLTKSGRIPHLKGEVHTNAAAKRLDANLAVGDVLTFVYDMEDFWEVELRVEDARMAYELPFPYYPICIDGARCAPLEGVGGLPGHEDFCAIMANSKHPEHQELRDWAGFFPDEEFNPEYFTPFEVNEEFALRLVEDYEEDVLPKDIEDLRAMCRILLADKMAGAANLSLTMVAAREAAAEFEASEQPPES